MVKERFRKSSGEYESFIGIILNRSPVGRPWIHTMATTWGLNTRPVVTERAKQRSFAMTSTNRIRQ